MIVWHQFLKWKPSSIFTASDLQMSIAYYLRHFQSICVGSILSWTLPPARPCATNCPYIPWAWAIAALLPWELLNRIELKSFCSEKNLCRGWTAPLEGSNIQYGVPSRRNIRLYPTHNLMSLTVTVSKPEPGYWLIISQPSRGAPFAPAQNLPWGLHRSQRSEAPICCALRNWSTRACHDRNQVAAVVSWWDLVTAWFRWWVGERNRGWESTEERKVSHQDWRETSHILEALLIPEIKQQVFQFTRVKKHLKLKLKT